MPSYADALLSMLNGNGTPGGVIPVGYDANQSVLGV